MNMSYYTTSAFAAISAALLIHRARQKPPVPSPKSPLQRLTTLSNNLIQKYQSLHPRLAHDIQNNISGARRLILCTFHLCLCMFWGFGEGSMHLSISPGPSDMGS